LLFAAVPDKMNLMSFFRYAVLFLSLFLLSLANQGCATAPTRQHDVVSIEHGRASWYGSEQGRHTASGERFNARALTAAHRHLPFGTIIRVTNLENGLRVDVRINDRGPWRHGRVLDLTSAAADVLKMKRSGIVPVEIEVLKLGSPKRRHFTSL
jgi:rare lipoprotein A